MARMRERVAIAISSAIVVGGLVAMLQPPEQSSREEREAGRMERQVGDLADSHEQQTERQRQAGEEQAKAERERRLVPGERRPPEPRVRIRLVP